MKKKSLFKQTIAYIITIVMVVGLMNGLVFEKRVQAAEDYSNAGCVRWVKDRAKSVLGLELGSIGNGNQVYNNLKARGYEVGSTPRKNSIACYTNNPYVPGCGHVAYVEDVKGSNVYFSEGGYHYYDEKTGVHDWGMFLGYKGVKYRTKAEADKWSGVTGFQGYVYLQKSTPTIVTPSAPTNAKVNKSDIGLDDVLTATWNASSGATKYNVTLTCTTNSANNQTTTTGGTSASFSIKKAGTYIVSVSASNSAGTSGKTNTGNCVAHENVTVKYVDWENQIIGKEQSIKWGGNANAPTPPEREGYTFQNWSSDGKNLKADTTIVAQYKINTYSVSFVDYNGDIIGKVQKIDYKSAAIEPLVEDIPCKNGYIFAGWDTTEYKEVKKTLTVKAIYVWGNSDLPIITEITSAKRNDEGTGYTIDVDLTNFPDNFTKGKLVVGLMTKNGKMVASETRSISMSETGEVREKITVLYSGIASRVQVSMVGVIDDETTGTPKSKIVTGAVDVGNEWSDWNTTVPKGDDIIKESRTEYRCKNSQIIVATGTPTTPAGYSLTSTVNTGTYTSWGGWSSWSRTSKSSNSLTDVQSQDGYRVYAWVCSKCGRRDPLGGACSGCGKNTLVWNQTEDTMTGYKRGYLSTATNGDNISGIGKGRVIINNVSWYFELNGVSNGEPQSRSVSGNGKGQVIYTIYRYRTRQEYKNYTYWQDDFGDWQPEIIENDSTKQVETRTTYRFKTNSTDVPCYNYKRYKYTNLNTGKVVYTYSSIYPDSMDYPGEWEYNKTYVELNKVATVDENIELFNGTGEDSWYKADINNESLNTIFETRDTLEDTSGVQRTVEGTIENAAGKVATLLVYKGQNSDPVASQIEYISQIKIGEDGKYKFEFITKEEPTTKTGDFIITLGIEGATNYQVIGSIEAPKKVFTVDFVDDEGNSIGEQKKVTDGGTVEAPEAPEKEGYEFIGWDTGLKNIRENTVITAEYRKKTYIVVYVDWDNTSVDVKTYEYGQELEMPEVTLEKEGERFEKWIDDEGNAVRTVTKDVIVTAQYTETKYTVKFMDIDGNVISEQEVEYGESAVLPDPPSSNDEKQVFDSWSTQGDELYVTRDIYATPVMRWKNNASEPLFNVKGEDNSEKEVGIYTLNSKTDIYYYVDEHEKSDDESYADNHVFELYDEPIIVSKNATVYAYAKGETTNASDITSVDIIMDQEPSTAEETTTEEPSTQPVIETTTQEPTTKQVEETTKKEEAPDVSVPKSPKGLQGITDKDDNYNIFWEKSEKAVYYNVYVNDELIGNTVSSNYCIPASVFKTVGDYIIEVEAVNTNRVSDRASIVYTVENVIETESGTEATETAEITIDYGEADVTTQTEDEVTESSTTPEIMTTKEMDLQNTTSESARETSTNIQNTNGTVEKQKITNSVITNIKNLKSKKKAIKVSWKKKVKINGYQIQYSTSPKFKKAKMITIKKAKATSKIIKKLKNKKKYYVRIRTYIIVNDKKYYSKWSKKKGVKTK